MNLASISDEMLTSMHRVVFELCKVTSDAVTANRRAAADNYPSPLADELNAAHPSLRDDMDAAYRMWDAIVAETETRRHRMQLLLEAKRLTEVTSEWVADGEVIESARGDVTWIITGTEC